jgi:CheY-like chemotaxis protein
MPGKTARPHLCLVCWDQSKAGEHATGLEKAGYRITLVTSSVTGWISYVRDLAVDAVVLDLDRLPSHGREVGIHLRTSKSTRHLPLVFLGGDPAKAERVRIDLPDATFSVWHDAAQAIARAIDSPVAKPVRPTPMMERSNRSDLAKRLDIKPGLPVYLWGDADFLYEALGDASASLTITRNAKRQACLCLAATRVAAEVEAVFEASAGYAAGSSIWIIHPKQSGRYATDFNQNDVRATGLAHGWVDYKVCAVDNDWSGLKFSRRKPGKALTPRSMKHAVDAVPVNRAKARQRSVSRPLQSE